MDVYVNNNGKRELLNITKVGTDDLWYRDAVFVQVYMNISAHLSMCLYECSCVRLCCLCMCVNVVSFKLVCRCVYVPVIQWKWAGEPADCKRSSSCRDVILGHI